MKQGSQESLAQTAGSFAEGLPPARLRRHFSRAWRHSNEGANELRFVVVPDGCIDLILIGGELRIAGPDTAPMVEAIGARSHAFGLSFRPGAAASLLDLPASQLAGQRIRLEAILGPRAARFEAMIADARSAAEAQSCFLEAIGELAAARPPAEMLAPAIWRELFVARDRRSAGLRRLASRLGLSERTLRRRSLDYFGHAPDRLGAIARLQLFLAEAGREKVKGLAELALLAGDADQAHLTRECRRLTGLTPAALRLQLARGGP
jgi:AraC-like DNA-binding protein